MGKLVYLTNVSLDVLIEDERGSPWETSPELAAQSDLTAELVGSWAAASRGTSR